MGKLFIKENSANQLHLFTVQDENQNVKYYVTEMKTLLTRRNFLIFDAEKKQLGKISRIRNSFGLYDLPRYQIRVDGWKEIEIKKDMREFKEEYLVKGEELAIKGDSTNKNFSIYQGTKKVASIQKPDLNNKEVWEITIVEESLEKLIICFIIGISIVQQLEYVPVN